MVFEFERRRQHTHMEGMLKRQAIMMGMTRTDKGNGLTNRQPRDH